MPDRTEKWSPTKATEAPAEPTPAEPSSPGEFIRSPANRSPYVAVEDDGMGPLREYINSTPGSYKCAFDRGAVQICQDFRQGFQGRGCERYPTGEIYVGEYMAGERYGRGTFRHANGQTLVSSWKDNRPVGEGSSGPPTTKRPRG